MMDKKEQLKRINTELKIYINESSFISNASRNKLIRSLENNSLQFKEILLFSI